MTVRWPAGPLSRRHRPRQYPRYDRVHPPADRPGRHRPRTRRPEGGKSRGADAGRPADAGRLLPDARMPIGIRSRHLGIDDLLRAISTTPTCRRRAGCRSRSGSALYEQPIAPEILEPLLAAWRAQRADSPLRRGALLGADRGSQGRQFRRPVRELSRPRRRSRIPHRRARLLGRAVDHACAPLHGEPRPFARGHRDGRADPAAGCRRAPRAAA